MSLSNWSPKEFIQLLKLFDQSRGCHSSFDGQVVFGIAERDLKRALWWFDLSKYASWLVHIGFTNLVIEHTDCDSVFVEVEVLDEKTVFYRDPMTFRKQVIPISEVAVYKIDEFKFLNLLADCFDVPEMGRDGISDPIIPEVMWRLGEGRLDHGLKTDLWVIRDIRANWDQIVRTVANSGHSGLILSCTPCEPNYWPIIKNCKLINLKELIVDTQTVATLDKGKLYRLAIGETEHTNNHRSHIDYDPHQRKLTIVGKEPWIIQGNKQAKAVEYMVNQAKRDRWELPANEILNAANEGQTGTKRLSALFGVVSPWQDYIVNKKRGYYGFNI